MLSLEGPRQPTEEPYQWTHVDLSLDAVLKLTLSAPPKQFLISPWDQFFPPLQMVVILTCKKEAISGLCRVVLFSLGPFWLQIEHPLR